MDTGGFSPQSLLFPSISNNEILPKHNNHICNTCGVVFLSPKPSEELLYKYYNDTYRKSEFAITTSDGTIDLPIQFPESASSFYKFKNFIDCIENCSDKNSDILPSKDDLMVDIGGYQGMFLYAAQQKYGVSGIVIDYNKSGIEYAKKAFDFNQSQAVKSNYEFFLEKKANFVTMVHSLEHIDDPKGLLEHIKNNILDKSGYLYIEAPNLFGSPLNDPAHCFTFSKESLTYLLNLCNFEILYMGTAGNPFAPLTLANSELVLVCLAKINYDNLEPTTDTKNLRKKVLNSYAKHSRKAIFRQARKTLRELLKLCYYVLGHFILEKISRNLYGTIRRLKRLTSYRIH